MGHADRSLGLNGKGAQPDGARETLVLLGIVVLQADLELNRLCKPSGTQVTIEHLLIYAYCLITVPVSLPVQKGLDEQKLGATIMYGIVF